MLGKLSCMQRESGWVAKFSLETPMTQGNHHYLVTQVNCRLQLELSRPLNKQAGRVQAAISLAFSSIHSQRFQLECIGCWVKVMLSLSWKGLGVECILLSLPVDRPSALGSGWRRVYSPLSVHEGSIWC